MQLSPESSVEYRKVYQDDTGEDVSLDEAREMATRLITLYELISRQLPGEIAPANRTPSAIANLSWLHHS